MPAEGEVTHMACVQEASLHFSVVNFFSSEDVTGVSAVGCWVAATCLAVFRHGERRGSCPGSSQSKRDTDKTIPTQKNGLKYHLSDIRPILTSNWNTKYIYKGYRWDRVVSVLCSCLYVRNSTGTKDSGALFEKGIFFCLVGRLHLCFLNKNKEN